MNKYQNELKKFRPLDDIQDYYTTKQDKGYYFIPTASHGFLVVPTSDKNYVKALEIKGKDSYGYQGSQAIYLEEDCQALDFLKQV